MNLDEAKKVTAQLSNKTKRPSWYMWTGGWYEMGGNENYYLKHDYLTPESLVLEVGTYHGEWAYNILSTYGCRYLGFELATKAYDAAVERLLPFENAEVMHFGVSDENGTAILYDTERDSANLFSGGGRQETVPLMDIAEIVDSVPYVDLFCMNCEGEEFKILRRLIESEEINSIDRMMLQWHSVIPYAFANWVQIESLLAETHTMEWNLGAWELWSAT